MSDFFTTPWTAACQTSLSMGFPRQGYWSGLPFPSLEDLTDPGIKPVSPALGRWIFYHWAPREAPRVRLAGQKKIKISKKRLWSLNVPDYIKTLHVLRRKGLFSPALSDICEVAWKKSIFLVRKIISKLWIRVFIMRRFPFVSKTDF